MLEKIIKLGIDNNASSIHLSSGNRPALRILGDVVILDERILDNNQVKEIALACLGEKKYAEFIKTGDMDAAYEIPQVGRFRVNAFKQLRGISLVINIIAGKTPELSELGLPESINKILGFKDGLVLVTGPTANGKSTTLAAVINEFNKNKKMNIITIEDPVEFIHKPDLSIINHRELGEDTKSFSTALKAALREDPNIILVGEMRDAESISAAVTAAETGHLVLSTLHTLGAAKTIDRIVDVFPHEQQQQIRVQLSQTLKAVVSQRLLKSADGKSRVAACEIMFATPAISNLIRENKTSNINQVIQTGAAEGMITMEKSLADLRAKGIV